MKCFTDYLTDNGLTQKVHDLAPLSPLFYRPFIVYAQTNPKPTQQAILARPPTQPLFIAAEGELPTHNTHTLRARLR